MQIGVISKTTGEACIINLHDVYHSQVDPDTGRIAYYTEDEVYYHITNQAENLKFLEKFNFIRIDGSILANVDKITGFEDNCILLGKGNQRKIKVGRPNLKSLKQKLAMKEKAEE